MALYVNGDVYPPSTAAKLEAFANRERVNRSEALRRVIEASAIIAAIELPTIPKKPGRSQAMLSYSPRKGKAMVRKVIGEAHNKGKPNKQDSVEVDGVTYRSVWAAWKALEISGNPWWHQPFRKNSRTLQIEVS